MNGWAKNGVIEMVFLWRKLGQEQRFTDQDRRTEFLKVVDQFGTTGCADRAVHGSLLRNLP